ncbi:intercellular adhesion protein [Philodulcilactobacillus myokoensis]|uniref:Intercellular adhesion protein n=1 Tax=Philodulcilactobacillus myokoensis TaxID=2929573 RepID=A0A9W6ETW2_9LACO|nr:polysaccharide deacetylase family protein [Philodulcilactobacillus myokoensis]GLB47244.1 intercellular adhesion protein [Philodulcilactobacillus myokoensis]
MKRSTRKILVWIGAIIVVIGLSFAIKQNVQYDKGGNENYALDRKSEAQKNGILVFCYHRVLQNTPGVQIARALSNNSQLHDFEVPLNQFKSQMKFLKQHHIKVISSAEMVKMVNGHKPIKGKYAVLSFDDIDVTTVENAIPVMRKYHYPFTTFVITGNTGRYREGTQLATWPEIQRSKRLSGNLMTLGLHTNNMHYLTPQLIPIFNLPQNYHRFTVDFGISKKTMYKKMKVHSNSFAYPYGGGTNRTNDFLHSQHLSWVATLDGGVITKKTNLQYTPRMIINSNSWPSIAHWYEKK